MYKCHIYDKARGVMGLDSGISGSIYGALGVITEEMQDVEKDPNTMAAGTGTRKPYNSIGGAWG